MMSHNTLAVLLPAWNHRKTQGTIKMETFPGMIVFIMFTSIPFFADLQAEAVQIPSFLGSCLSPCCETGLFILALSVDDLLSPLG